jgi:hypothetical protein
LVKKFQEWFLKFPECISLERWNATVSKFMHISRWHNVELSTPIKGFSIRWKRTCKSKSNNCFLKTKNSILEHRRTKNNTYNLLSCFDLKFLSRKFSNAPDISAQPNRYTTVDMLKKIVQFCRLCHNEHWNTSHW